MFSISQKGLLPGILSSAHHFWSGCGLSRAFSSCQTRAARRIPTEEELSTMSARLRWYYRKIEDPVYRRQSWDAKAAHHARYLAEAKLTGEYARMREMEDERKRARYQQEPEHRFAKIMNAWLFRLSAESRKAHEWKTHMPMIYPEKIRKTCSTCLSHHAHGARLW